jgi:CDP-4-dehydro-6-deoxyglucose reductase
MADLFPIRVAPQGAQFECAAGQTLLDAAIAAGIWLPHSCKSGTCGSCELPVAAGEVQYPSGTDAPANGHCRTCQATPLSALELVAPDVPKEPGQRVVTAGGRVIATQRPSADVTIVQVQLPVSSGFSFRPGQYADVLLRDGSRRSYSMANRPNEEGVIEWHIRRMEGGKFSTHAYDRLKEKDILRIQGPYGTFVLHDSQRPIVFLASGTGYAPIASLLNSHLEAIAQRGAILYWGARQWSDLYGVTSVEDWQAKFSGVRLVPVLSDADAAWSGRTGLVHQAVLDDLPDLSAHEVYACGNPLMIDAARQSFVTCAGLAPESFHSDAFVTTPR